MQNKIYKTHERITKKDKTLALKLFSLPGAALISRRAKYFSKLKSFQFLQDTFTLKRQSIFIEKLKIKLQ